MSEVKKKTIDLEQQKQAFLSVCRETISRDGLEQLLDWLCKSDFFTAPASTRFHGAYAGGLCEHSLDVYEYARKLAELVAPDQISEESLAISALFHDVCKCHMYKQDFRNQKNKSTGEWEKVPCYTVDERFHFGGHGSKSVYQIQYFMKLEKPEAVAINCHMGFSDGSRTAIREVSAAYTDFPLAWVIHAADEAATYLLGR